MTGKTISVGIIDSGISGPLAGKVLDHRSFSDETGIEDNLGHGTRVAEIICQEAAEAQLVIAKVFGSRPTTQPVIIAEALDWLAGQQVSIVNMSFGLTADRKPLAEACARAGDQGMLLVASAPAQGTPCYPAAYDSVISVTGDARCDTGVISTLDGIAQFGTWCASPEHDVAATVSGASIAAAHFTGLAAGWLTANAQATHDDLVAHLRKTATIRGPEHRSISRCR
ncbi:MAG: S8 family serine peptidase [Rhizobiales bacterium]|nr:S8 family serine peptidase [Hyphomicrobiales bacterium]